MHELCTNGLINYFICMFSVYFGVKSCCDMHVGVGYRSGMKFPPALILLKPKKVKPRRTRFGMGADGQMGNPVVYSNLMCQIHVITFF